ncbi:MAG TPA: hypothetical protein VD886_04340 [Herpetosiphonaceae bacterium]|nr:hypothetical protein [Herpetosiphonaceae bacterium]
MADERERAELIALVERILAAQNDEDERERLIAAFEQRVINPEARYLIYFPYHCGLGENPSAEEIVDATLAFRPFLM